MNIKKFCQNPWKTSHPAYHGSVFSITPAPEYANSEVLMASLYRTIGYRGVRDGDIPSAGRDMQKKLERLQAGLDDAPEGATLDAGTWNALLHDVLESPKVRKQSTKRFLQVTPVVPSVALFSGSARLATNSWVAGNLIRRMVWIGSRDHASALGLWRDLFNALAVSEHDDVFARWLEWEEAHWRENASWEFVEPTADEVKSLDLEDLDRLEAFPAGQFVEDLRAIVNAKDLMTRRQWTSMLETVVRLAAVAHVVWLCDVQARIWRCVDEACDGQGPASAGEAREAIFPDRPRYMTYSGQALNGLRDKASAYLASRLGLNTLLWTLSDSGVSIEGDLCSSQGVSRFCEHVRNNTGILKGAGFRKTLADVRESQARALGCRKGIGVNLEEFARHVLGRRDTASPLFRGYDQGYILNQAYKRSPWVVSMGPLAVLSFVHCALAGLNGPRSIHRLSDYLAAYGILVDHRDIAVNDLGHQLRMLGLVLDSPDAESGMLLRPPFQNQSQGAKVHG